MIRFGHAGSVLSSRAETVRCNQPAILVPELTSGHALLADLLYRERWACASGRASILMMKAADVWEGNHLSALR